MRALLPHLRDASSFLEEGAGPLPHPPCDYSALTSTPQTQNDSYALLGELAPCGFTDKQTCLKTVVLLADNKKNVGVPASHPPSSPGPTALLSPCPLGLACRWWPSSRTAASC